MEMYGEELVKVEKVWISEARPGLADPEETPMWVVAPAAGNACRSLLAVFAAVGSAGRPKCSSVMVSRRRMPSEASTIVPSTSQRMHDQGQMSGMGSSLRGG